MKGSEDKALISFSRAMQQTRKPDKQRGDTCTTDSGVAGVSSR